MLIGNEAKVTPYPLVEANAIKKLSPNVKITFNLNSNATVFKKLIIGYSVGAFPDQNEIWSFMNVT